MQKQNLYCCYKQWKERREIFERVILSGYVPQYLIPQGKGRQTVEKKRFDFDMHRNRIGVGVGVGVTITYLQF